MNVSRPTLTRIYAKARKTVAEAFVEGKSLVIEGGSVDFGENGIVVATVTWLWMAVTDNIILAETAETGAGVMNSNQ